MSSVRTSIDIDVPPEKVWEFVMDPAHSSEWVTIHRGSKGHDTGALRPGFKMDQRLCLRGVNFDVHWRVVELRAPRLPGWGGKGPARSQARLPHPPSDHRNGGP